MSNKKERSRHFSVIKDRRTNQWMLRYGAVKYAAAYCDYEGSLDRPNVTGQEWILVNDDFDSKMAWHGQYKKDSHNPSMFWGKVFHEDE